MAQETVISSSSFACEWTYDVFLNFRGEDTRNNFTGNLYDSLDQKGIRTFIDDEGLRRGEEIKPALLKAIQESRIAIIVFSKNYATSTYCLDELVEILKHLKAEGRLVWPVFYDVNPSEVRHQSGSFADALVKHEERFQDDKGKVQKWREALYEAANLSGWHFKQGSQYEHKFIKNIINEVSKKLNHTPLHIADNPVGLQSPVLEVKSLLGLGSDEGANMVGICGIGGIGKTTIARVVYNLIADQFDGLCFLADIREKAINKHGLVQLQETLLSEILGEKDIKVGDVNKGIPLIKRRLQRKKVLLILDDVDKLEQLKAIAGGYDWFGPGSQIIITSRNKHLLAAHGVIKVYEVKELNKKQALELFSWNAFKSNKVDPSYADISNRVLSYVSGLPLALEVIGSNLYGKRIDEWNSALDKYEQVPKKEIQEILKVSYDGLEEDEKNIFLDIACFFNKYKRAYVREMLHARGFHPEDGIRVLIDRSLLKIDNLGCVRMHDLIQDMGREIVRQESKREPGERSRLWCDRDIVRVLQENMGTDKIEVIILKCIDKEVHWNGEAFKKMRNLRVLIIGDAQFSEGAQHLPNSLRVLDWSGYPSSSLPSDFHPNELIILSLPDSCFKLDKPHKMFDSLGFMDFDDCKFLIQVPDLSGLPNLRALCLDNCTNLIKIHDSIGFLDKLILLSAQGCIKLHTFVNGVKLPSLETLDLRWCTSLKCFPEVLGMMENIRDVYLDHTAIEELPFSIQNLIGLERLYLRRCTNLNLLPSSIQLLRKLEVIIVYGRRGFQLFEPDKVQEKVISKVFMCTSLQVHNSSAIFSNVYCITIGNNNVIQGYSPLSNVTLPGGCISESKGSSVSFWFRKRFPEVSLLLIWEPDLFVDINSSVLEFRLCVLINGTNQFTSSCDYIISATRVTEPLCLCVFLGDLQCKTDQGILKRVFSEHEWNHVEVSYELKYHWPYDLKWVSSGQNRTITGTIKWSSIHVDEQNIWKEDFQFTNPPFCVDRMFDGLDLQRFLAKVQELDVVLFRDLEGYLAKVQEPLKQKYFMYHDIVKFCYFQRYLVKVHELDAVKFWDLGGFLAKVQELDVVKFKDLQEYLTKVQELLEQKWAWIQKQFQEEQFQRIQEQFQEQFQRIQEQFQEQFQQQSQQQFQQFQRIQEQFQEQFQQFQELQRIQEQFQKQFQEQFHLTMKAKYQARFLTTFQTTMKMKYQAYRFCWDSLQLCNKGNSTPSLMMRGSGEGKKLLQLILKPFKRNLG